MRAPLAPAFHRGWRIADRPRRRRSSGALGLLAAVPVMAAAMLLQPAATVAAPPAAAPPGGGIVVPFARASRHVREKFITDTVTPLTTAQDRGPFNITPGGFLRGVLLIVSGAGGALGGGTLDPDYPFKLISSITLENVNGSPIVGPVSGYELYLANKYLAGSWFMGDPTKATSYVATVNAFFAIYVPLEIRSDGLGALANTDARSQYRVKYTIDTLANIIAAGAPTAPALTITGFVDTWSQVEPTNLRGEPQEQTPPGLGTTMFLSRQVPTVAAGAATVKHDRVGNLIRGWAYVARTSAGARADHLTDPIRLRLDTQYLIPSESPDARIQTMARQYGCGSLVSDRETGVYVYGYSRDLGGHPGPGDESNWLETTESTFLQLESTLAAGASSLTVLTQDVAPVGEFPYPSEVA